jgi:transposase
MDTLDTCHKPVDALPLLKQAMQRIRLYELLDKYVPNDNEADIAPAQVLCILVMNLLHAPQPLYHIPQWLAPYLDGLGEEAAEAAKYNDDRSARVLDALFAADRGSLLAELSARIIDVHQLDTACIHNDTTSITLQGAYEEPEPGAAVPCHGYNKDHRPDCKQLVFGLNVTSDGHVPLSFKLYDGNQADVSTHRPNWQGLRQLLGRSDFIYVADSKLCALETLQSLDSHGGRFITVMPRNFQPVAAFLGTVREGFDIPWQQTLTRPDSRHKDKQQYYRLYEAAECWQGFRLLWVHSSSKAALEAGIRRQLLESSERELAAFATKLGRSGLASADAIEQALNKLLGKARAFFAVQLIEQSHTRTVKVGRGRPGPNSQYEERTHTTFELRWQRNEAAIAQAARADGLFPLVHNTGLPPEDVLLTYKDQPHLEKRFATGKSVLEIAPVFLKTPRRIEAMLLLFFIALMLLSLIERAIRQAMARQRIKALPIRSSGLKTNAPTWRVIRQFFTGVGLSMLRQDGQLLRCSLKGLTGLHEQVLLLLGVPLDTYRRLQDRWWLLGPA